ncbi:hypothetical protein U6B65_04795 [Oscillospiraceae bacterium MB08-C2-2]|nr:hypothetical protein U6B65_04795 [Oscillospiraceae bacterium MB08-C2-2]
MQLQNLYFGKNDGKEEAAYNQNFEQYFFNYDDNYQKILQPDKFLLLGRKGSGKSMLSEYIQKKAKLSNAPWMCEIVSYKDFKFTELQILKTKDEEYPNEYTEIWHWLILICISKMLLQDQKLQSSSEYNSLNNFFLKNYTSIKITANKIVQITKSNEVEGGFLKDFFSLGGKHGSESISEKGSYLEYIENLESIVLSLLSQTNTRLTLIFDELDDRFRNNVEYKSILISLLKITAKLNRQFFSNGLDCKLITLVRTDIMDVLNDGDLNKICIDAGVRIDWGNSVDKFSPLMQMIYNKIRKSIKNMSGKSDNDIYYSLFPENINGRKTEEFILGRTFFRPRDIVTYCNFIVSDRDFSHSDRFIWFHFVQKEEDYSRYFLQEIKNELCGHYDDPVITQMFKLLAQLRKVEFEYSDVEEFYAKHHTRLFPDIELNTTLDALYIFGAIGNKWFNEYKQRDFYSWNYRKEAEIDFDKRFVVHLGLRKALGLS